MTSQSNAESRNDVAPAPQTLWLNIAFVALLCWFLVTSAYHGALNTASPISGIDFRLFFLAAQRLNDGKPLYLPSEQLYAYSPLLAILLRPLAMLPFLSALRIWFFVNAACVILSAVIFALASKLSLRDTPAIGLFLIVGFRTWAATMNFALGQCNFVMLFIVACVYLACSRQKPGTVSALIALAALFKVWLLGLILYQLIRRQWKYAALTLGIYAAALFALFAFVGFGEFKPFIATVMATGRMIVSVQAPQSIYGFALMHLHANSIVDPISTNTAAFVGFLVISVLIVIYGMFQLLRHGNDYTPFQDQITLGLTVVSVLLLLPPCENEYLVLAVPLIWTLIASSGTQATVASPRMLLALFLIYIALSRLTPYVPVADIYRHGLISFVVSLPMLAISALWIVGMRAFWLSNKQEVESNVPNVELERISVPTA